jgi:ubiquinone/menaquinone biosynthesis C-methylase UbiE
MLAIGREWPPVAGAAPIAYIESTATALPLPDAAFDAAFCQQGLQHMADPLTAAREMRRTLKPGGRVGIALWVKSPFGLFREVVANLGITSDGPSPSDLGKDERELREFLRSAGFEDVQVERREHVAILEGGVP